jgi:hypothetical protein
VNSFIVAPHTLAAFTLASAHIPREQLIICCALSGSFSGGLSGALPDSTEAVALANSIPQLCQTATYLDAIWLHSPTAESVITLEKSVQASHLLAYGPWGNTNWDMWLSYAEQAVLTVYGRRKRAGLRTAFIYAAGGAWAAATQAVPPHAESILDTAARLGWLVVAEGCTQWHLGSAVLSLMPPPPPADTDHAQQLFATLARTEAALAKALGGWPHHAGLPVFSVGQGRLPWASHYEHAAWQQHVWPTLMHLWQQTAQPEAQAYLAAWQAFLPHAASLISAHEAHTLTQLHHALQPYVPPAWHDQTWPCLSAGIVGSLPGVTSVAVPLEALSAGGCTAVLERPDITDMAPFIIG